MGPGHAVHYETYSSPCSMGCGHLAFGRNGYGSRKAANFRGRLTAALSKHGLSAQISPFIWSGANSVRERDKAARELAEHIRAKRTEYPASRQVVVAHSHGGNVALRALDQLGVEQEQIFIATIATPFVEVLQSKLPSEEIERYELVLLGFFIILILAISAFVTGLLGFAGIAELLAFALIGLVGIVPAAFCMYTLSKKNATKVIRLVELTYLSSSVRRHPIMVLRAVDDEASLGLGAAAIGNWLSALIQRVLFRISNFVVLSFGAPLLTLALLFLPNSVLPDYLQVKTLANLQTQLEAIGDPWLPYLRVPVAVGFCALYAFLLAPGIFKSAYGRELLFNSQGCEINSQSAPDSVDRQATFPMSLDPTATSWGLVVTLHQAEVVRKGLRHGLYDDPECAERIASWLKGQLSRRKESRRKRKRA